MIDQVLRAVLPQLDRLGIPYLITGGIAATLHGRPRFTQDIDFVIAPSRNQLEDLVDALDVDFAINRDAAREAHARRGEFNAIIEPWCSRWTSGSPPATRSTSRALPGPQNWR